MAVVGGWNISLYKHVKNVTVINACADLVQLSLVQGIIWIVMVVSVCGALDRTASARRSVSCILLVCLIGQFVCCSIAGIELMSAVGDNCPNASDGAVEASAMDSPPPPSVSGTGGLQVYTAAVLNILLVFGAALVITVMCVLSSECRGLCPITVSSGGNTASSMRFRFKDETDEPEAPATSDYHNLNLSDPNRVHHALPPKRVRRAPRTGHSPALIAMKPGSVLAGSSNVLTLTVQPPRELTIAAAAHATGSGSVAASGSAAPTAGVTASGAVIPPRALTFPSTPPTGSPALSATAATVVVESFVAPPRPQTPQTPGCDDSGMLTPLRLGTPKLAAVTRSLTSNTSIARSDGIPLPPPTTTELTELPAAAALFPIVISAGSPAEPLS